VHAEHPGVRQLGSKLLAGGLSAGVVLLWWPMFFPTDSVTTWLCRGIVWTLVFELLLVALSPFELALWNTHRGERISQRVEAKRALLDHESPKRRIGRRAALAITALALPLALIAVGVSSHIPTGHAATPPKVMQVTRVVRVVKPVRVQRVVKIRTVSQPVPVVSQSTYTAPAAAVRKRTHKHASAPTKHVSAPATPAPQAHVKAPVQQTAPTTQTGDSPPATQNQSPLPAADHSGAAAQPTT
jgi:hypothetical protein